MQEYFNFKGQKYTKNEIIKALSDIDNKKYEFSCKDGKKYKLKYNQKEYNIKQVCECLAGNRNIIIKYDDFKCTRSLRNKLDMLGFEIISI